MNYEETNNLSVNTTGSITMDSGLPLGISNSDPDDITIKKLRAEKHRTMRSISKTENIPIAHLKACRTLNLAGFNADDSINWVILKPLYLTNLDKITEILNDTLDVLKKQKLKEEVLFKQLTNAELQKKMINISDINDFVTLLAIQLNGLLSGKIVKELPPQVVGKSEEEIRYTCKEMVNEIVGILKKDITEWQPEIK